MAKWIVGSAWPYVNAVPHLGNLIGSILSADVFARFLRLMDEDVVAVSGSDEHGTPIEVEARKRGMEPKELTDKMHNYVKSLFERFEIAFDNYTRTHNDVHIKFVQETFMKIYENGYVFTKDLLMPYCLKDEMFLPDRFVTGTCPYCGAKGARGDQCDFCGKLLDPVDLIDPKCSLCGSRPTWRKTKHFFFDLPKAAKGLDQWIKESDLPENVKNTTLHWLKEGLTPRAITRDNKWGIPAPFPGAEGKTIYVWFEAVLGYLSAVKELDVKNGTNLFEYFWKDQSSRPVYFIGKDNIPFHSIILPALLRATGEEYPLPYNISATEYLMYEGKKFSKSRRIGVWIDEALKLVPEPDYWRFALIRMRPEDRDTNFTWSEFYRIVNSELNDDIGNFAHRVLTLIKRKLNGNVNGKIDEEIARKIEELHDKYVKAMYQVRMKEATNYLLEMARLGNKYLNEKEPWKLLKCCPEKASDVLYTSLYILREIALHLAPFAPASAQRLWEMLGEEGDVNSKGTLAKEHSRPPKNEIGEPKPLFKKLPEEFSDPNYVEGLLQEIREEVEKERPIPFFT
ncbi:methionyl-tRNA synthetase [Ignicoccus islandicus DSM 13165]|uniref:Methionine--tRNA ligase n=1 Tax=Ignicoccus islandicus DSM 13165 TaxID=940295 RepID=A0A0U3FN18_9CREN|nr:methionine--tRNA ligase [Ignicoccus islandicus]ALU11759.1 methionyl-tRNA synthetase [Ignicoccus islandicus DSM 13165]